MGNFNYTHVEDLKQTDWVVVVDTMEEEEYTTVYTPEGSMSINMRPRDKNVPKIDGMPYCVLAVSFPFIGVTNGVSGKFAIDMRKVRVRKVTEEYAMLMAPFVNDYDWIENKDGTHKIVANLDNPVDVPALPHHTTTCGECPRCGNDLTQRLVSGGGWFLYCCECGSRFPLDQLRKQ